MNPKTALMPIVIVFVALCGTADAQSVKYVRYERGGAAHYGILDDDTINELRGNFLEAVAPTGKSVALSDVKLLAPVEPRKVFAVGLNYASHLGGAEPSETPPIFLKLPTCIVGPEEPIVIPNGAESVHFEAEMVLVIGKRAKNVPEDEAMDYLFGITCGNDVSARVWQRNDLQWFRGKAPDTFGPIGPAIVSGLDPSDLKLEGRLNGETMQEQTTGDLIHDAAAIISFISQTTTLERGDVIFTGTPGSTKAIRPGDTVEIELEGVGVLSNPVAAEK